MSHIHRLTLLMETRWSVTVKFIMRCCGKSLTLIFCFNSFFACLWLFQSNKIASRFSQRSWALPLKSWRMVLRLKACGRLWAEVALMWDDGSVALFRYWDHEGNNICIYLCKSQAIDSVSTEMFNTINILNFWFLLLGYVRICIRFCSI